MIHIYTILLLLPISAFQLNLTFWSIQYLPQNSLQTELSLFQSKVTALLEKENTNFTNA